MSSHYRQNNLDGPSPSAPEWSKTRVMENQMYPKCQAEVWTALTTETRASSRLKTHLLGWYWICSWRIFKARHGGRLETTVFICLARIWVKQHPDSHSLISIWFFWSIFFLFQLQKRKKWSTDKHLVKLRSHWDGGTTFYKWAQM